MSNGRQSDLQEVCGLWERESQSGRSYIGGRVADGEPITIPAGSFVMVFSNDSDNPRAPAFRLMFSPPKDQAQSERPQQRQGSAFGKFKNQGENQQAQRQEPAIRQRDPGEPAPDDVDDSDIPF